MSVQTIHFLRPPPPPKKEYTSTFLSAKNPHENYKYEIVLNIKLAVFKARKNWHPTISSHRQSQFPFVIAHQNNSHPAFTVRALFANLLTRNLLNPCHSLANNPPLLLYPTTINTLEQRKVNIPITNWLPTYGHAVRCHLGSSPI